MYQLGAQGCQGLYIGITAVKRYLRYDTGAVIKL
ncbi:Uncharacterized [Syntrophomonas zehnderi OL-4]|uniref:Uncharacterized n=1 Tax=Syntrophomonas zehnderi OL-4 TaxID=690567 RepID=A0A0E4C7P6_9FIRM|nr:Uncharacterized [Syntrophomonas zehnderi OL-4]